MDSSASTPKGLGILGWDGYEFLVADFERSRRFYTEMMDIEEVARLAPAESARRGEESVLYQAGNASFVCTTSKERGSRAEQWLARRPDGVAVLGIRVRDLDHARRVFEQRAATFCTGVQAAADQAGRPYRWFDIASPLGAVRFRFIERAPDGLPPGFTPLEPAGRRNQHGFQVIDHVTSNFLTIEPFVSWLRDILGFEEYWRVHFHTQNVNPDSGGSGLASIVMWDPESGIKFANNEPAAPNYEASQIYTFCAANSGPGVQHVAFHVPKILPAVEGLRGRGIEFLSTPATYYDLLPQRMAQRRVSKIQERTEELRRLQILVDGEDDKYLLQIFMVEGGLLHRDPQAGPFFYEVIQRRGARGFGEGNFRALFEAIERDQQQRGVVQAQLKAGAGS